MKGRSTRLERNAGEAGVRQAPAPARTPGKQTRTQRLSLRSRGTAGAASAARGATPGEQRPAGSTSPVQRKAVGTAPTQAAHEVHDLARHGVSGAPCGLPYSDWLQRSFGHHALDGVEAHVGGPAADASAAMGARAYASGERVAFAAAPDLHTTAHEAAHVVQQRAGVQLENGLGAANDRYERHADLVADQVVRGQSAETLLDQVATPGSSLERSSADAAIQRQEGGEDNRSLLELLCNALEVYGPVHYTGLIEAIDAASTSERQAALGDASLRELINQRLTAEWASTVFSSLMVGSQTWVNPTGNDFFDYFVTQQGTGTLPDSASMNCWESVIFAAYLANQLDAAWIRTFYETALQSGDPNLTIWTTLGFSLSLPTYAPPGSEGGDNTVTPAVGQLIFYYSEGAYPGHVAVSLGGDQAISLWSKPNNVDAVQRIQVTDLEGTVYVGNPPW